MIGLILLYLQRALLIAVNIVGVIAVYQEVKRGFEVGLKMEFEDEDDEWELDDLDDDNEE